MPVIPRIYIPRSTVRHNCRARTVHPCFYIYRDTDFQIRHFVVKSMGKDRTLCPCPHDTSTYYLGNETWEVRRVRFGNEAPLELQLDTPI